MRIVGIVGAGFMGSGIAEAMAVAGVRTVVHEPEPEPLDRSRERVGASVARAVDRGKLDPAAASDALARLSYTTRFEDLEACELVVEAVTEDVWIKTDVFRRLGETMPDEAILASNTSSIPIADLAKAAGGSDRVLGLHFFSPVPVMKLAEVIPALGTAPGVVAAAEDLLRQIGKHPIRSPDRAGFVVNVLLVPYLVSAVRLYEEGFASREDIDEGMRLGCGHPMGPLTLCDFIGLDVVDGICRSLYEEHRRPEYAAPPLLRRMVAAGRLGRKSGHGFYDYAAPRAVVGAAA